MERSIHITSSDYTGVHLIRRVPGLDARERSQTRHARLPGSSAGVPVFVVGTSRVRDRRATGMQGATDLTLGVNRWDNQGEPFCVHVQNVQIVVDR